MKKFMFLIGAAAMLFATSCLNGTPSAGTSSASYVGKLTVYDTDDQEVSYTDDEASVTICNQILMWIQKNILVQKYKFSLFFTRDKELKIKTEI